MKVLVGTLLAACVSPAVCLRSTDIPKAVTADVSQSVTPDPPCLEESTDYYGHDIGSSIEQNINDCSIKCSQTSGCKAFTFNNTSKYCYLKYSKAGRQKNVNGVSGIIPCPTRSCMSIGAENVGHMLGEATPEKNAIDCQEKCYKNSDCTGFTFNMVLGECSIFSSITNVLTFSPRTISGPPLCVTPKCYDFGPAANTVIRQVAATTVAQCSDICSTTPGCRSFSLDTSQNTCSILGGKPTKVVSVNPTCTDQPISCFEFGMNYYGNDIGGKGWPAETVDACQALCLERADCKYFTYHVKTGLCWLKTKYTGRVDADDAVSGPESCFKPASIRCAEHNVGYPGNDMTAVSAANLPECIEKCKSTANCIAYSFDRPPKKCYIKNKIGDKKINNHTDAGAIACGADLCHKVATKFVGPVVSTIKNIETAMTCGRVCKASPKCTHFNYTYDGTCTLLSSLASTVVNQLDYVSGPKSC